jgi:hypothetical protein
MEVLNMKKLLSIFGATALIASTGSTITSCNLFGPKDSVTVKDFKTKYTGDSPATIYIKQENLDQIRFLDGHSYDPSKIEFPDNDGTIEGANDYYYALNSIESILSDISLNTITYEQDYHHSNHGHGHVTTLEKHLFDDQGQFHRSAFSNWFAFPTVSTKEKFSAGFISHIWKNWSNYKDIFEKTHEASPLQVVFNSESDCTFTGEYFSPEINDHKMSELFSEGSIQVSFVLKLQDS